MLEFLQKEMEEREITSFIAKENRIMCFPHVINITVQRVLSVMSLGKVPEGDDDIDVSSDNRDSDDGGRRIGQTFEAACAADPISRLRNIVMTIRSSGQRRDAFMTWIKTGNENGWFLNKGKAVHVVPRQLLRDVRTRWDSTYQMIKRCIEMRLVRIFKSLPIAAINVFTFQAIDTFLKRPVGDLEHLALTKREWEVLQEFAYILSVSSLHHSNTILNLFFSSPTPSKRSCLEKELRY
jgi:hypothetical protein